MHSPAADKSEQVEEKGEGRSMPPPPRLSLSTQNTYERGRRESAPIAETPTQTGDDPMEETRERHPFTPFFTLVNDTSGTNGEGGNTHHPSKIHYIFSDDDSSEVLTASLLSSLESADRPSVSASRSSLERSEEGRQGRSETSGGSSSGTFARRRKGEKIEGQGQGKVKEERVIIVDINEAGDKVEKVSSLSKNWQVLNASLENAPTFEDAGVGGRGEGFGGLMLRIEGIGREKNQSGESEVNSRSGMGMGEEEMGTLLEGFDRKMAILRKIAESGDVKVIGLGVETQDGADV